MHSMTNSRGTREARKASETRETRETLRLVRPVKPEKIELCSLCNQAMSSTAYRTSHELKPFQFWPLAKFHSDRWSHVYSHSLPPAYPPQPEGWTTHQWQTGNLPSTPGYSIAELLRRTTWRSFPHSLPQPLPLPPGPRTQPTTQVPQGAPRLKAQVPFLTPPKATHNGPPDTLDP